MLRLSRQYRVLALVWAVLQFALPAVVTIADAVGSARSGASAVMHVEGSSSKSCRPPHSAECGLCRYMSAHVMTDSGIRTPEWPLAEVAALAETCPVFEGASAQFFPPSRAPPVV